MLKDIWLSFLPGAKIGIVGVNGAGKSTLMRIMAGIDNEFVGEAWAAEGVRVGYLRQEPELDPALDVFGNMMKAVADKKALLDRYNEIAANYTDETADEMAQFQDKIDAQGLWDLNSQVEKAMDALRCPDGRRESRRNCRAAKNGAWRCAGCCSKRPTFCCSTNRPTISTPNPSPGSNIRYANSRALSCSSPMTVIFSTM